LFLFPIFFAEQHVVSPSPQANIVQEEAAAAAAAASAR